VSFLQPNEHAPGLMMPGVCCVIATTQEHDKNQDADHELMVKTNLLKVCMLSV